MSCEPPAESQYATGNTVKGKQDGGSRGMSGSLAARLIVRTSTPASLPPLKEEITRYFDDFEGAPCDASAESILGWWKVLPSSDSRLERLTITSEACCNFPNH